ncbi:MAG: hypothetical protein BroJett018_54150 [Chloroflexota bacterium]|nr:MAG: hypothetical protein BroJett018_54150 [Chloroflexota bacterium]
MSNELTLECLPKELLVGFEETFENVQGIYLDRGTSLFETLATISAEEASRPVGKTCATIAAQVEHVRFYLEVNERLMLGQEIGQLDWGHIWRTVSSVTPAEWETSVQRLKETYQRIVGHIQNPACWSTVEMLWGTMAILVHTAYHLGEIRQALCTVKE